MDPTTTVRTDSLPAIATIVIPGVVACGPYVWLFLEAAPAVTAYLNEHEGLATLTAVVVSLGAGFSVESAGSYLETYGIDRRRSDYKWMMDTWWKFLCLEWQNPPVGDGYIKRLLVSFKYELNMCVAAGACLPGLLALVLRGHISTSIGVSALLAALLAVFLFYRAARGSADVLVRVRHDLVQSASRRQTAPPPPPPGPSGTP
jgi:hypothetical protein